MHPACQHCQTAAATEVDHIIPDAEGGPTTLANAQGLCAACHAKKTRAEITRGIRRQRARAARLKQRPTEPHPGLRH